MTTHGRIDAEDLKIMNFDNKENNYHINNENNNNNNNNNNDNNMMKKQMSIEIFASSIGKKREHETENADVNEKTNKMLKMEKVIEVINLETPTCEILNSATTTRIEKNDSKEIKIVQVDLNSKSEEKRLQREKEKEERRLIKESEEEKKREIKRQKKLEEEERRILKKQREEEERLIKRKKIEAEKKARQELKERERLEKQKKREEEIKLREEKKRIEEEEKNRKRAELEKKKQEKLLEKQKIEEEKERKRLEEENKKKKRSIMNFFKIKSNTEDVKNNNNILHYKDVSSTPVIEEKSEFEQYFLPFHVNPNVTVADNSKPISAKWNDFIRAPFSYNDREVEDENIDNDILTPVKSERAINVLKCLNTGSINEANEIFHNVPLKYFKFYESKKPAYFGTFSYTISDINETEVNLKLDQCKKITINSINNNGMDDIPNIAIDYDYDSEADIPDDGEEDDEEGEDLNSADEDEDAEDEEMGSSDIDEFVETDNDITGESKKRVIGPLIAVVRNCNEEINDGDEFGEYFKTLQWERLHENIQFPINPFKDYWKTEKKTKEEKEINNISTNKSITSTSDSNTNASSDVKTISSPIAMSVKKKVITDSGHISALLTFVQTHNTLSLNTLAELAVKDASCGLAEYSRAVVKNTVKAYASFDKKSGWRCENQM
jgi:chromatin assembly factor 1 subunit A